MKIQISYQGVTVSVEGDDVTFDMLSSLYDQLKAKIESLTPIVVVRGGDLVFPSPGYGEYVKGMVRKSPEVIHDSLTVKKAAEQQHQTMAERGIINSPDRKFMSSLEEQRR